MKAEELYARVIESYKNLLSLKGSATPGLQVYCRGHQLSYRNFLIWATNSELATGIKEVESRKKRLIEKKDIEAGSVCSPKPSCKKATKETPLLYPLHIITGISEPDGEAVSNPVMLIENQNIQPSGSVCPPYGLSGHPVLYGIRITFPNGVNLSIREADSYGIYTLVYGY
ncbi:MAG: hypothetical protein LBD23_13300 [Oscillospiraceae bacterium]|nr:hypothetical protein [Oscillospiraceae bacterium]